MAKAESAQPGIKATQLHPTVRALGIVSLLNDLSSEVTVRTLPLFLANVLGVRTGIIGLIEGIAETTATLLKLVSGYVSDRLGKKKALALWGYSLSNLTKPLLYFASSWTLVLIVRFLDRVGKGIRSAPRDALIADVTHPEDRGRAFGFNKGMDKAGGFIGIMLAAGVIYLTQRNSIALTWETYRWLVLLAVLPGIAAVAIVGSWVEERPTVPVKLSSTHLWSELGGQFWAFIGILTLFTLGNSSDAFLMLRAQTLGLSLVEIFLLVALFNLVISVTSTKAGALSDTLGRRRLIAIGWIIYAFVYFGLAYASAEWHMWVLYTAYGLYYGAFQGASSALVADLVPQRLRGSAYGIFNAALGIAAFPASVIAGVLWEWYGPSAPFFFGGAIALISTMGWLMLNMQHNQRA